MLTYAIEEAEGPIYLYIYQCIKEDILAGLLKPGEKLPSKRTFAKNNGISTITIQNAYDQLISEGYVYSIAKKGYFVSRIEGLTRKVVCVDGMQKADQIILIPREERYEIDLSGNEVSSENFPFSVWAKVSREVMADRKQELMTIAPASGLRVLREAICDHLRSFRGMQVDPDQIIIGAGTEYLYGMLTELLGTEKVYAIENPGYTKLLNIYRQRKISCRPASMDDFGVTVTGLLSCGAEVAHICPNHHFPTGITMPAARRYEILNWADEEAGRYIIEDDYDSEFRLEGRPIPTLFSIDDSQKVIYMNTFSKSLSPTIRISYMVLPVHLANAFYQTMSFYSCTVSNFEQYTLAEFIKKGYFEKHINRMRHYYSRQRKTVMGLIKNSALGEKCRIHENDAGLHFLIEFATDRPDEELEHALREKGVKIRTLQDYYFRHEQEKQHCFLINYSNLDPEKVQDALDLIAQILEEV